MVCLLELLLVIIVYFDSDVFLWLGILLFKVIFKIVSVIFFIRIGIKVYI